MRCRTPADMQNNPVRQPQGGFCHPYRDWPPNQEAEDSISCLFSPTSSPSIVRTPEAQLLFFVPLKSIQDPHSLPSATRVSESVPSRRY